MTEDRPRYFRTNYPGVGYSIEDLPDTPPQTAISARDKAGGIYLNPINDDPGSDELTARVDSKRRTITPLR
jgi:hypothetical protein